MRERISVSNLMKRLDHLQPDERSYLMSKVRSANTTPEIILRRALWARGVRYLTPSGYKRRYNEHLAGRPDIIFPGAKLAVFVDGCFWHGCPLKCKGEPSTNQNFWKRKFEENKKRDEEVNRRLEELGWEVRRYWEHEIIRIQELNRVVSEIVAVVAARRGHRN